MSLWDGLVVDINAADTCGELLKSTSEEMRKIQSIESEDYYSTIIANSNCSLALEKLNEIRQLIADYLDVDKSVFNTIVSDLKDFDKSVGDSYGEK